MATRDGEAAGTPAPAAPRGFTAFGPRGIRRLLNLWPPFLFAGIRVTAIGADWRSARVELRMRPWNRNYVGTHFGGSLFAMTDPFWMLLVMRSLGRDYIVWDRAGEIAFLKPGRGVVHAEFALGEDVLDTLRTAASGQPVRDDPALSITASGAVLRWFDTNVLDAQGDVVARVRKQLYVRRKRADQRAGTGSAADATREPGAGTLQ